LQLIRDKGFEHEAAVLARLEKLHGPTERIPSRGSLANRARLTREAIERGATLIYQGCPYRKSNPDVLMVQTSEVWGWHDTANGLHSTRRWCILVQR